jgi:glutaredoxin
MPHITLLKTYQPKDTDFEAYCKELAETTKYLSCNERPSGGLPGMALRENLIFHALPSGMERGPFLEILDSLEQGLSNVPERLKEKIALIRAPAFLKIFISNACPFCPSVVRTIASMALASPLISVAVIDAELFPEVAKEEGVRSVPTLVLNSDIHWSGIVKADEVLEVLITRDPTKLSASSLEALLKDGRAALLADNMARNGRIYPALMELLAHPSWPVRMGAMLTMEELKERDSALAASAVDMIIPLLRNAPDTTKGDLIYVIGEVGERGAAEKLTAALEGEISGEVGAVLQEAIQKLRALS